MSATDPGAGERRWHCGHCSIPASIPAEPDAGDVEELTEAEREALFTRARELSVSRDTAILETVVGRILAARLAAVRREAEVKALTEAADVLPGHFPVGEGPREWLHRRAARLGGA